MSSNKNIDGMILAGLRIVVGLTRSLIDERSAADKRVRELLDVVLYENEDRGV